MKKITIVMVTLLFIAAAFHPVPERVITGSITSASDGIALAGVTVMLKGTMTGTVTDGKGEYQISVPATGGTLTFSFIGFIPQEVRIGNSNRIDVRLVEDLQTLQEVVVTGVRESRRASLSNSVSKMDIGAPVESEYQQSWNTEEYDGITENIFHSALRNPLSTFSIDVDAASYSNVRRFIENGQSPPKDAVRIEELINYFDYDYKQPGDEHPFRIHTEISVAPWNEKHKLVHVGLQGKEIPTEDLPPSNLVFLLDVSGSMNAPNKLPLLK